MSDHKIAELLLVEDDPIDVQIFNKAAAKAGLDVPIQIAETGEEALRYLQGAQAERGRVQTLVITDINMPGLTGHELMEDVRKNEHLRKTIFFVLSSSDQPKDVAMAYDNGAAGYIVKEPSNAATESCAEMLKAYCAAISLP